MRNIFDGFVGRIGAHVHETVRAYRTADPIEFRPVELNLGSFGKLFEVKRGINRPQGQAVRFGEIVNLICADQPGRSRNVLNDDVGTSRNVLRHEFRDEAWIKIINVARLGSRNYRNCLALIKRRLCRDT